MHSKFFLALFALLFLCLVTSCGGGGSSAEEEEPPSYKPYFANFHCHSSSQGEVADSGHVAITQLKTDYEAAGYDLFVWTPHSDTATENETSLSEFAQLAGTMPIAGYGAVAHLGVELTVKDGPNYSTLFGYSNNNHMSIFGFSKPVPHKLTYRAGVELAHANGGVCIINHPGPGPAEWELDYWTRPDLLMLADGIEVFNGQLAELNIFESNDYRWAVAQGAMLASTANTDAHESDSPLDCATLVFAESAAMPDVLEAVRQRRTVALYKFFDNSPTEVAYLGEQVVGEETVTLTISFDQPVQTIRLYRDSTLHKEFSNVSQVGEEVYGDEQAAWSWYFSDGSSRGQTSAIWTRSAPAQLPDFAFEMTDDGLYVVNIGHSSASTRIASSTSPPCRRNQTEHGIGRTRCR
ncbi:MAG: hypothetical protein U5N86_00570 [Planctomycetota bacterium]|nr:hypothetical protein [Planctomycetota bacterium]